MGKEVLQSVKLKDVRRIITDKNHIILHYKVGIVGYFSYLDIYVHPVDHSSMSSWRYTNPFILDLKSGTVIYEVLKNNDVLPYPEAKIHEDKVLVTKNVPSSSRYGYILDLF